MNDFLSSISAIMGESAPYLLLGFALAGVLHVALARFPGITRRLTRPGRRSVAWGALIGVPMPLCSCSVLPAAMALRRDGASKGATASFLVSVPETDVVSILVTLALIGPVMAIYRPIAAIMSALTTGFTIDALPDRMKSASPAHSAAADPCHCAPAASAPGPSAARAPWWKRALDYGFVEIFDDIILQLLLGIALAALIGTWLPTINAGALGNNMLLQYAVMLGLGIPLYVCATASTPIAAGFIAGGISPGAAMVFLLAGPATNVASLVVLRAEFGLRFLVTYLAAVAASSVALGVLFDVLIGTLTLPPVAASVHAHGGLSVFRLVAIAVVVILAGVSVVRTRALQRGASRLKHLSTRMLAR
jgi:uncharacterized membrane protein YraQ (UPF0718 family)